MGIKLKVIVVTMILFLSIGLFFGMIIEKSSAEEQQAEISFIGEPTYMLTNEIIKNNRVIGRTFTINITLYNAGNKKSEELAVNISDEEGFSLKKYTYLDPGETKIISFKWSTLINRDQKIVVRYLPADLDAAWTQYNHGSKTFTIKIEDKDGLPATSTPGFEVLLIIIAIIIYAFLRKKKEHR